VLSATVVLAPNTAVEFVKMHTPTLLLAIMVLCTFSVAYLSASIPGTFVPMFPEIVDSGTLLRV
jgi:hypothetical protein